MLADPTNAPLGKPKNTFTRTPFAFSETHLLAANYPSEDQESSGQVELMEPKVRKAPRYSVIMLNDNYTAMEFVVLVLETIFHMPREKAERVMLQVHTEGSAVCGVYPLQIAESLCDEVDRVAEINQYPLKCEVQPLDDGDNE